jgi:hypothetical protein
MPTERKTHQEQAKEPGGSRPPSPQPNRPPGGDRDPEEEGSAGKTQT